MHQINTYFYFETTLDKDNKHIVNYGIAQYFKGDEHIFNNIDEFCDWAFDKKHHNYTLIIHNAKRLRLSIYIGMTCKTRN